MYTWPIKTTSDQSELALQSLINNSIMNTVFPVGRLPDRSGVLQHPVKHTWNPMHARRLLVLAPVTFLSDIWHIPRRTLCPARCSSWSAAEIRFGQKPGHENQKCWREGNTCHVISNDSFSMYSDTHTHARTLDCSHASSLSSVQPWACVCEFAVVLKVCVCVEGFLLAVRFGRHLVYFR